MIRITCVVILLVSASAILAQELRQQDKSYTMSVDVQLVQLPVSVLNKDGHPVTGLQKDHFQVFEDGVLQEISLFKHEDVPVSVGLVIDNSGSMRNKRESVNSAALTFAKESNPEDESFIVNFDDSAYLEQDFTSSINDLVKALGHLDTRGETALYDALYLSAEHLNEGQKDKKALLLITGGGLFSKPPSKRAREVLEKFAETTGGRAYFPKSVDEIEGLCRRIAHDLRNHYTLGYTPSNRKLDGSWRMTTIRLNPPKTVSKVTVRVKEGYYAPKAPDTTER